MINGSLPSPCLGGEPRARLGREEPDSICLCLGVSEICCTLGWLHLMDLDSMGTFWGHLGPGADGEGVASSQVSRLGQESHGSGDVASLTTQGLATGLALASGT